MKQKLRRVWHFIWEDNSALSWGVNVVLAFVIIKFLVYPGLGFVLETENPVVAVVSCSMEHRSTNCGEKHNGEPTAIRLCGKTFEESRFFTADEYWSTCGSWYEDRDISQSDFQSFPLRSGFNKGDLIILRGKEPEEIVSGDVIVFQQGSPEPIIHRVINSEQVGNVLSGEHYVYNTKGDQNPGQIVKYDELGRVLIDEKNVNDRQIIGTAAFRIPFLGYVKIIFTNLVGLVL